MSTIIAPGEGGGSIYTDGQTRALQSLYYVTPPLSLMGSLVIIYCILKGGGAMKNVNRTFVRLMLGYAVMDVLQTIVWLTLGPWATPRDNPFVHDATGNQATCNVKGIFLNLTFGLMLYSTSLACFHAMKVSFEWPDYFISKGFEPAMHILSWLWPTFVGMPSVWYENVNPYSILPGTCWITNIENGRGTDQAKAVQRVFGFTTFFLSLLLTMIAFTILFCKARAIEQRLARYSAGASAVSLSRKLGRQGMRYSLAFLFCNISWPFLVFVDVDRKNAGNFFFPIATYSLLFTPLQGFVNAVLFLESHRAIFDRGGPLYGLTRLRSNVESLTHRRSSTVKHSIGSSLPEVNVPVEVRDS